jgi:radical SAM superfamily enzyme
MKKPHLVILEEVDGTPLKGGCSSCKDVVFSTGSSVGFAREHKQNMEDQFREHFRNVHEREDASQAAARIVREATENK